MKLALTTFVLASAFASAASADTFAVGPGDTIEKLLTAQAGKVVTLRLGGDQELTGKVKSASAEVVHLAELSGKDFYDAAVSTKSISAVIVRAR